MAILESQTCDVEASRCKRLLEGGFGMPTENADATGAMLQDSIRLLGSVPLRAIVCSHLGHEVARHVAVARYVSRSVLEAKASGESLLVAAGSAIEPWVARASVLFGVPMVRLHLGRERKSIEETSGKHPLRELHLPFGADERRDEFVVLLADRVDCVYVRARGRLFSAIGKRLQTDASPQTRIAVHPTLADQMKRPLHRLMDQGAVGWYRHHGRTAASPEVGRAFLEWNESDEQGTWKAQVADDWVFDQDEWLIHCTRGCSGPWPGQSTEGYRDELLLADETNPLELQRSPLGSLHRILRMNRLIGNHVVSRTRFRVVCFSADSLQNVLGRRKFRPHLHRWDCEPYGIAIRKSAATQCGIAPVIYGPKQRRRELPDADAYRFQARGETYDWTEEKEWRCLGDVDLSDFRTGDVKVFVGESCDAERLHTRCSVTAVSTLSEIVAG
ncbi:MAG: hypothetical protein AAFV88_25375 [Planctomycetota bacterium]